jgi:hypothetical protein
MQNVNSIYNPHKTRSARNEENVEKVNTLPATVELMYAPRQAANSSEDKLHILRK